MNKKVLAAVALATIMPLANVLADDTATTTTSPENSKGAMKSQFQQQRQENQQLREQNQQARADLKDQKQQNQQARCQNIQTRIQDRISKYDSNKQTFENAFTNMQERLTRLSTKLATAGVDVTQLNADITTLGTKINTLKSDRAAFISGLQDAATTAASNCDNTPQGGFMGKVLSARNGSQKVQQDVLDIKNFFQKTIRPEIMAIRSKLASEKTTTTTATDKTSTTSATTSDDTSKTL